MFGTTRLWIAIIILILIVAVGTVGYRVLEGWSFVESLYTTVTTLSTVGYGDYYPMTTAGRLFTVVLIVIGVGTMLYAIGLLTEHCWRRASSAPKALSAPCRRMRRTCTSS